MKLGEEYSEICLLEENEEELLQPSITILRELNEDTK